MLVDQFFFSYFFLDLYLLEYLSRCLYEWNTHVDDVVMQHTEKIERYIFYHMWAIEYYFLYSGLKCGLHIKVRLILIFFFRIVVFSLPIICTRYSTLQCHLINTINFISFQITKNTSGIKNLFVLVGWNVYIASN